MAQTLFTGQVPDSHDLTDGIVLQLGTYITPDVAGTVSALRFRFPVTSQDPVKVALFRVSDSTKLTPVSDPVFSSPVQDDWNEVTLVTPIDVAADVEYCVAARVLRYTSSPAGSVFPVTNGDLDAAGPGRYTTADPDGSVQFPNNESSSCYFTDMVFTAAEPSEGAAALGLGIAVSAAGERAAEGSAAAGVALAVAAAGERASKAVASLGVALAVSAAGEAVRAGAAALGISFAVVAQGRNGDAGRPVATFPWTPRPVRSFSEVTE